MKLKFIGGPWDGRQIDNSFPIPGAKYDLIADDAIIVEGHAGEYVGESPSIDAHLVEAGFSPTLKVYRWTHSPR